MRGHCRKNGNFDYLNRLAFRIFSQRFNLKHKPFVLVHNLNDEIFSPVIQYFDGGVLHLLQRIPSKLDVSAHKPEHETISLMDYKPRKIVNDVRLISPETNLAYYSEDFVFSSLTKIEQITKTMIIFKTSAIFSLLHSLRSNTFANFRPAARAYSQRYHFFVVSAHTFYKCFVRTFYATSRCTENDNYMSEQV